MDITNILSVDTTTKTAAVSLKNKENKLIERFKENEITHSEKLLPLIDEVLKESNLNIKDIDMYAILSGPGSFTGVRIGLSTIKAFLMVTNKKAFAISALEEIAIIEYIKRNTKDEKYILSLIDAKNNRVYYSVYKVKYINNKISTNIIIPENNDTIENVILNIQDKLKDISKDILIAGDCVNAYNEIIKNNFDSYLIDNFYPTPTDVINTINIIDDVQKYIFDTFSLDAHYVRKSQAERIKNERVNK